MLSFWFSRRHQITPAQNQITVYPQLQPSKDLLLDSSFPALIMVKQSPAKIFRNVVRMTKFLERKKFTSTPSNLPASDPPSKKTSILSCSIQAVVSIAPIKSCLEIFKLPQQDIPSEATISNLSVVQNVGVDIRTRKIYHPTIINACQAIYKKHPDLLSQDEVLKFNEYRRWRSEMGQPLEANVNLSSNRRFTKLPYLWTSHLAHP